jgi:hypothetical protein
MNTKDVHAAGDYCAYWINGIGQKYKGRKFQHRQGIIIDANKEI